MENQNRAMLRTLLIVFAGIGLFGALFGLVSYFAGINIGFGVNAAISATITIAAVATIAVAAIKGRSIGVGILGMIGAWAYVLFDLVALCLNLGLTYLLINYDYSDISDIIPSISVTIIFNGVIGIVAFTLFLTGSKFPLSIKITLPVLLLMSLIISNVQSYITPTYIALGSIAYIITWGVTIALALKWSPDNN